ncbi:hypothetical protein LPMP_231450 [Leishmania panamensis]|uniref:Uncharacterized protein n=1 Tax=Leishmania panamensis TaxID=5679 RepID=A0A088RTL7_LEIPA|nr:hypothetical protein LPMP_231450 [Leishmania panamensis]AIN98594.1 hypothetical protein LPMP_231450 [Leishmania panamensis]
MQSPHSSLGSSLSADQTRHNTKDRDTRRNTLRAVQPSPPPHVPKRAMLPTFTPLSTTATRESDIRAAGYRGAPQASTRFPAAEMATAAQEELAMSHLRTPDSRDSSTLDRHRRQSIDLPPQQQRNLLQRGVGADMTPEALFTCIRLRPGTTLAEASGVPHNASVSADRYRNGSVSGPSGSSGRNESQLSIGDSCSPITLVVNSASASHANTNTSNATSVGSASTSGSVRFDLTTSTPSARAAPGSVAANNTQPKASSSSLMGQPEVVTSPLSAPHQALSTSLSGESRRRSSHSRKDSSAPLSAKTSISMEVPSQPRLSHCESSAGSCYTDIGVSSSPRPVVNRRVHFLLDEPEGGDLAATDHLTLPLRSSGDTRARLPLCLSTTTVSPTPSDTDKRLASNANSSSHTRLSLSGSSESFSERPQPGFSLGGAAMRPAASSLPLHPSVAPISQSGGASALSLHLNRKEGRIKAMTAFSQAESTSSNGTSATEVGGLSVNSAPSTMKTAAGSCSDAWSGFSGTHASATYQPGQPLPKPALKQVSRYSNDWNAGDSHAPSKLLTDSRSQWSRWRSIPSGGADMTAAAPPASPSSMSVMHRCFTSYLQRAFIPLEQGRGRDAVAPSATTGRAAGAGTSTTLYSSVRTAGSRGGGVELLVKWTLVSVVALVSFMLIFVDIVAD